MFELALDVGYMAVEVRAHRVFERERLDDAHALQRFLQRLQDARPAGPLIASHGADTPGQFSQHQRKRRRDHERDQRHQRILYDHHNKQRNQSQQVASGRGDQQVEDVGGGLCARGEAGDEFRAVMVAEEADVLLQQSCEQPALVLRHDAVADA